MTSIRCVCSWLFFTDLDEQSKQTGFLYDHVKTFGISSLDEEFNSQGGVIVEYIVRGAWVGFGGVIL